MNFYNFFRSSMEILLLLINIFTNEVFLIWTYDDFYYIISEYLKKYSVVKSN